MNIDEIIDRYNELSGNLDDTEKILIFFRQEGLSKTQSIMALIKIQNIDAENAKRLVHFSKAWNDRLENDQKFHDQLVSAVEGLKSQE